MPSFLNFNDIDSIIQIDIDESRNLVYTRSQNSAIQVFYLGTNGLETSKVCAIQASTISNRAAAIAK
jgi:nuclear pore complex protein Nup155